MTEAIRYAIGTFVLVTAAGVLFGGTPMPLILDLLLAGFLFVAGYVHIYRALGPVDWNVLLDGLLED